jgi:hypothetical protein
MAPVPPHLIEDDDGPSPLDAEGLNPFGGAPFGEGPFGPHEEDEDDDEAPATPSGETILQRHKVDVAFSKQKWFELRERWQREGKPLRKLPDEDAKRKRAADKRRAEYVAYKKRERKEAEQEAERKRTAPERARKAAKAKRERDAVAYASELEYRRALAGAQQYVAAMFAEAERQERLAEVQSYMLNLAAQRQFQMQQAAMIQEEMARQYRQAMLDRQEEEEALELLMAA